MMVQWSTLRTIELLRLLRGDVCRAWKTTLVLACKVDPRVLDIRTVQPIREWRTVVFLAELVLEFVCTMPLLLLFAVLLDLLPLCLKPVDLILHSNRLHMPGAIMLCRGEPFLKLFQITLHGK